MGESTKRPLVVGLTGGIGSGKSSAMHNLVALGAQGIDADQVAHEVMQPNGPAYPALKAEFGETIAGANGLIDRQRLAARVFSDPEALARLEAIVHPAVTEAVRELIAASPAPLVVIEAIKLLEAGLSRTLCDQVWVTVARREQQIARLMAGRGMTVAEIERRMAAQMPPEQMVAQADRVIDTSGTLAETALHVLAGWVSLDLPVPSATVRLATEGDAEGIAAVLNGIVRESRRTAIDRLFTVAEERNFLRRLPERAFVMVATVAGITGAFQVIEPYARYTGSMAHVAELGTFIAAPLRHGSVGPALAQATLERARAMNYKKLVVLVRADNEIAQAFYEALGFRQAGRLERQVFVDEHYVDALLFEHFLG